VTHVIDASSMRHYFLLRVSSLALAGRVVEFYEGRDAEPGVAGRLLSEG
jgi:hypothetical protein